MRQQVDFRETGAAKAVERAGARQKIVQRIVDAAAALQQAQVQATDELGTAHGKRASVKQEHAF